ncbi:hypothetical protein [Congregibacter litoralis]|nr:hypothetical protein [Congregibacter litoralis]
MENDIEHFGLSCEQTIAGVTTRNTHVSIRLSISGVLEEAGVSLLESQSPGLEASHWPTDEEALRVADAAFLKSGGDRSSPRREVFRIDRYYDASGPTVLLSHRECGVTTVNARTREAAYACVSPPHIPFFEPHGARERKTIISGLPAGTRPVAASLADRTTLLWSPDSDYDPGESYPGMLHAISLAGETLWQVRADGIGRTHILSTGTDVALVRVDRPDAQQQTVSTIILSGKTGEQIKTYPEWSIPAGAAIAVSADVSRIVHYYSDFDQSFIVASALDGSPAWRLALEPGVAVEDLTLSVEGELAVLLRRGFYQDPVNRPQYSLLRVGSEGQAQEHVLVDEESFFRPELLGLIGSKAFALGGSAWSADRRGTYLRSWHFLSQKRVDEMVVPRGYAVALTQKATLLYRATEGSDSIVGELSMEGKTLWSQLVDAGSDRQEFIIPMPLGDNLYLTTPQWFAQHYRSQQAVGALLVIDAAEAVSRADACKPLEGPAVQRRRPVGNVSIVVRKSPTFSLSRPGCAADADRVFSLSTDRLFEAIQATNAIGWEQQQIDILLEEGDPGIEFPREPRQDYERPQYTLVNAPGQLWFRAHPDDVEELADIIIEQVAPHLRIMEELRHRVYAVTGALVMVEYSDTSDTIADRLRAAEHTLRLLLDIVEAGYANESPRVRLSPNEFEMAYGRVPSMTISGGALQGFRPTDYAEAMEPLALEGLSRTAFVKLVDRLAALRAEQEAT